MMRAKAVVLSHELTLSQLDDYIMEQETSISDAVRKRKCPKHFLELRSAGLEAIGMRMERTIDMTVKIKPKGKR